MIHRLVISSLDHLIRVIKGHPEALALSSLAPLKYVAQEAAKEAKSCGCNAKKVYMAHKGTFEAALGNLGYGDHLQLKNILKVDEICYYEKSSDGGPSKLKCL